MMYVYLKHITVRIIYINKIIIIISFLEPHKLLVLTHTSAMNYSTSVDSLKTNEHINNEVIWCY